MIIKEIKINAFGVLNKFNLSFDKGINVLYGENEKGKSTIEAFIKIMLYGFSKKKVNGEIERKRYLPFNGDLMSGELIVEHKDSEYIIKRSFGITKKQDVSLVIHAISGEQAEEINNEEPGKSFLGINRSTFEKTLFVSQLGVAISKDREEEIMDKITAIFGCSEDEVPVAKAIEKLEGIKKSLTTIRGVGSLDLNKKREQEIINELYEANKLCEKNLKWEEELYVEKDRRAYLEEEINKLEVYKKYLKKSGLQKEYKEIADYLLQSEELKQKEAEIATQLNSGDEIVNETYLDNLREDNIQYINLLGKVNEISLERNLIKSEIDNLKQVISKYNFIHEFGDGLKDKIINLKYEQQSLKEKINNMQNSITEINFYEKDLSERRDSFENYKVLSKIKEEIENTFNQYERKLYEMKSAVENKSVDGKIIMAASIFIIIGVALIFLGMPFNIIGIIMSLSFVFILLKGIFFSKNKTVSGLAHEVKELENRLDGYLKVTNAKDYVDLMNLIKKYSMFRTYEDKVQFTINEKRKLISEDDFKKANDKYNKNNMLIIKIKKASECNNIEELIEKINEYEDVKIRLYSVELEYESRNKNLQICNQALSNKENEIRNKLKLINLEDIDLSNLGNSINDFTSRLKRYREIQNNLISIEETYKVLLKDRDIEQIKNDLKNVISNENSYTFASEEEVESEEKKKTKELLECEKNIKDLENNIKNRLIGKRDLVSIQEELDEVKEKVYEQNKKLKAVELSTEVLKECLDKTRKEVGPEMNRMIAENFKSLTKDKYFEVLLGDNYEMMVRDSENLFKGLYLSNGAQDQLYLSLRIALIQLLFKDEDRLVILDDALIQYDDNRRKEALMLLKERVTGQLIIFTCQNIEASILDEQKIQYKYIKL